MSVKDRPINKLMKTGIRKKFLDSKYLLLLFAPCFVYYVLFKYLPLWGILISFKNYSPFIGFFDSPWVGFKYYEMFFAYNGFLRLIRNTFLLSFYSLLWGFPAPIIFALILNEVRNMRIKRLVQTVSYLPHFISTVVVVSMVKMFLSPRGVINSLLINIGIGRIDFMTDPGYFRTIYVASGIWQDLGWGSIIYLSALSSIDPNLYEAALIDGANKLKQLIYITLPCIAPTIITMFLLRTGGLLSVGFEKVYLMQVPVTYETSDVINTFVFRQGLISGNFSYASAVGLFNSVVNVMFLVTANYLARYSENSLW